MRTWLLAFFIISCLACGGGPAVEGTWLLREVMSHRCRNVADLGLACEDDSTLDPGYREGIVQIQDLGSQRLRLIDVDGRATVGRAYTDGARFVWFERNNRDAGACVEDSSETLEFFVDGDGLEGQRRIQTAHSEGCGSQGSSDLGYVLQARPVEVMRDRADNVVIVCSIENLDPMGVHTGDSITVAPAQTLTDREYQRMRDAALRVIRRVGVATGGSNIQFAVNPKDGELHVIEMNPRVSRSSALASKATGFPIAKIAARLALGTTLDHITNDITRSTLACFEPVLDYVVVKIPRFDLAKFPGASDGLGPQMKSIGEVMAIGRTFAEAFRKGLASLDHAVARAPLPVDDAALGQPSPTRVLTVIAALRAGRSVDEVYRQTRIDPWFLQQFANMLAEEARVAELCLEQVDAVELTAIKRHGLQDAELARLWSCDERRVRQRRRELGVQPSFLRVDTCAGEFESHTPYLYSSYESRCEAAPTGRRKVMILGSGANRIGQGIEFDYCCCHAAYALRARDVETLLVNCNPETVSTDYDTADRLYFEPLRLEQVLAIAQREQVDGVIVQLGGQTPLTLARELESEGLKILGTPTAAQSALNAIAQSGDVVHRVRSLQELHADGAMARIDQLKNQPPPDAPHLTRDHGSHPKPSPTG